MNATTITFLAQQAVTASVPLILAGLGELVAERSGIINIGIEGLMLTGCFAAFTVAAATGSPAAAIAAAAGAAIVLAMLFAIVTVYFRADQIVAGAALNLLAAGLTAALWSPLESRSFIAPAAEITRHPITFLHLDDLFFFGPVFFNQYALCYCLGALALILWFILRHTRTGLIIRALGDAPDACAASGIPVRPARIFCLLFAAATAGIAGSYLSIMRNHQFSPDMTGGQGFLVLALVIFGRWRVSGLITGCLAFGFLQSLQQLLRSDPSTAHIPEQFFTMLPYLATLIALAFLSRSAAAPAALGQPWPATR